MALRGDLRIPQGNLGLFMGRMGVALALYVLSRKEKNSGIADVADKMLSSILDKLGTIKTMSVDSGLLGIGLAVDYLMAEKYVEGEADDVLREIDAAVYREVMDSRIEIGLDSCSGLVGYLFYVVSRLGHTEKTNPVRHGLICASLRSIVDRLSGVVPSCIPDLPRDLYISVLWKYPLLFIVLGMALDLNAYNAKIVALLRSWSFYLKAYVPAGNVNKLYLAVSLAYLNKRVDSPEIEEQVNLLLHSCDFQKMPMEADPRIMDINEGWFFFVSLLKVAEMQFHGSVYENSMRICREKMLRVHMPLYGEFLKKKGLCVDLIHGLSGVEILQALFPQAFC